MGLGRREGGRGRMEGGREGGRGRREEGGRREGGRDEGVGGRGRVNKESGSGMKVDSTILHNMHYQVILP